MFWFLALLEEEPPELYLYEWAVFEIGLLYP